MQPGPGKGKEIAYQPRGALCGTPRKRLPTARAKCHLAAQLRPHLSASSTKTTAAAVVAWRGGRKPRAWSGLLSFCSFSQSFFEVNPLGAAPGPHVKTGARVRRYRGCKKANQKLPCKEDELHKSSCTPRTRPKPFNIRVRIDGDADGVLEVRPLQARAEAPALLRSPEAEPVTDERRVLGVAFVAIYLDQGNRCGR